MVDPMDESWSARGDAPDYSEACSDLAEHLWWRLEGEPGMTRTKVDNLFRFIVQVATPQSSMGTPLEEALDGVRQGVRIIVEDWSLEDLVGYAKEVDKGGRRVMTV